MNLKQWYSKHQKQIQEDFFQFLRFKSISSESDHKGDVQKCASWLKDYLRKFHIEAEMIETSSHPLILAKTPHIANAPTVLIYGHYDVQPVDPLDEWKTEPFEPTLDGKEVFARGASDNKGQIFYTITAIRALLELKQLPVNVILCIEGEEECGSEGLKEVLSQIQPKIQADYLLVPDFDIPSMQTPAITLGARGIVTFNLSMENSFVDLHSGHLGGIVLNPLREMSRLLSSLWNEQGKVTVKGFYDEVQTFSEEEKKVLTIDPKEISKLYGIEAFAPEKPFNICQTNWIRPVLEINGFAGGYYGPGFKTVIPSKVTAKLSARIVPHQDPEKVGKCVSNYLKKQVAKGMKFSVEVHEGGRAVFGNPDSILAQVALDAYSEVFGKPAKRIYAGGSVPIVADLKEQAKADVVMLGVALGDDNIHAPNEHFGMDRFQMGFELLGSILMKLKL